MDLSTSYLGLKLKSPLVPSASTLSQELDGVRRMEDAGAAAVVLPSLFEEQLRRDQQELTHHLTEATNSFAEAQNFFPGIQHFHLGPEQYLEHLQKCKKSVKIPVIASLNGSSAGGWTNYAKQIEQAGADALELNVYYIPTDPMVPSEDVEQGYIDILQAVREVVKIPVALKISPFFSNMARMARRMDDAGADALVLFNRFYQPDIDLESLEVRPNPLLSTPMALRLPLTWIGILYGRVRSDLAATGGIHEAPDVLKAIMAGASVAMLCSALLRHGIDHLRKVEANLKAWMEEHEYDSVSQMRGSMSQLHCADPAAFERAQYVQAISRSWPQK